MPFRFVPLGVGDAFSARYYSTCLALVIEREGAGGHEDIWLVDCPHPIQKMLAEAKRTSAEPLDPARVRGVLLTHLHADHSSGLEGLAYWMRFYRQRKLELVAHPEVVARLWEGHLAAGMEQLMSSVGGAIQRMTLQDYFQVTPLRDDAALEIGGMTIECRRTIHHIPTYALRVRVGDRTLGHSADTAFDPSLIAWLGEADLVVHETNHGTHTPYAKLAELPADVRAKMRLVHYPDELDVAPSAIEALREGQLYVV